MDRAEDLGIKKKTLWRAKKKIGVKAHKIGIERWVWEFPQFGTKTPEDGQHVPERPSSVEVSET